MNTCAFGTTDPDGSVMVPRSVARSVCASNAVAPRPRSKSNLVPLRSTKTPNLIFRDEFIHNSRRKSKPRLTLSSAFQAGGQGGLLGGMVLIAEFAVEFGQVAVGDGAGSVQRQALQV